jgi:hypothetical protein
VVVLGAVQWLLTNDRGYYNPATLVALMVYIHGEWLLMAGQVTTGGFRYDITMYEYCEKNETCAYGLHIPPARDALFVNANE